MDNNLLDKLNIGDVVVIKDDIVAWEEYQGWVVTDEMYENRGKSFSIIDKKTGEYDNDVFTICRLSGNGISCFWFTPSMIEIVGNNINLEDKINIFDFLNK